MDVAEAVERRQLDHRLDLSFEQNRQDDDVQRRRFAQTGVDVDVIGRHVGEQDALFLEGALSDQSFAGSEAVRDVLSLAVGVAGEQFHIRHRPVPDLH